MAKRIGELLVEHKLLSSDQLTEAVSEQKKTGERLGSVLIRKGYVTVEDFEFLLSRQHSVPAINLLNYGPAQEVVSLVAEKFMKKNFVIPIEVHEKILTVAMANPHDYKVIDELRFMAGMRVAPVVSSMHGIRAKLRELFPSSGKSEEAPGRPDVEIIASHGLSKGEERKESVDAASRVPVVKLTTSVLRAAITKRATHVHLIPRGDGYDVKLRVNGALEPLLTPPQELCQGLVHRIKALAGIDVHQRRAPQEGFLRIRSDDRFFDLDVAVYPLCPLEQVVLTFRQPFPDEALPLENLGMTPEMLERYQSTIQARRGLILVLGPHDSGKTSTLYATLTALQSPTRSLMTYEDPIKNRLRGINQAEPHERAGGGYTEGLKALSRQNLDCLMVGEVPRPEALAVVVEAALGNTLVLARMLFNDTVGVIPRLVGQGVPAFSLSSALTAVVGQRLVRRLCPACREAFDPPEAVKEVLRRATGRDTSSLYRAAGCNGCKGTGYQGRVGLFEFLVPDDNLRDLIVRGAPQEELERAARSAGFRTLIEDGYAKAVDGLTTYEEVKGIK